MEGLFNIGEIVRIGMKDEYKNHVEGKVVSETSAGIRIELADGRHKVELWNEISGISIMQEKKIERNMRLVDSPF